MKERVVATAETTKRMIEACDVTDLRGRAFLDAGLRTGLRCKELCELTWADVDFASRTVRVRRGKRVGGIDRPRTVQLTAFQGWFELLHQQAVADGKTDGLCFVNRDGGQWQTTHVRRWLKRTRKAAAVDYTAHSMRHGHSAIVYRMTQDRNEVRRQLGHSRMMTTEIYLDSMPVQPGLVASLQIA